MLSKRKTFFLMLLFLTLFITGCSRFFGCSAEKEKPEENSRGQSEIPEEITKIETASLEIMYDADLIPLVELLSKQSGENTGTGEQKTEEDKKKKTEQDVELTFEKTILGEVLKRELDMKNNDEKNSQLSKNTEKIWDNIKITVTELHEDWNELEPVLIQKNMYPDTINSFEESLESVTIFVSEENYFGTLTAANELTGYLSKFLAPFAEKTISTVSELKYHTRNIVLSAAVDDFEEAQKSLNYMKEQNRSVISTLEGKNKYKDLNTSLNNLQRALDKQDIGLINIKAAIVMEDLIKIRGELK